MFINVSIKAGEYETRIEVDLADLGGETSTDVVVDELLDKGLETIRRAKEL